MDDKANLELYRARSDQAIKETSAKYGSYCYRIAYNILSCREDSQECVNDAYLAAWNTIPPKAPAILSTYLGKLTRYISLDRWKRRNAYKRGGGEVALLWKNWVNVLPMAIHRRKPMSKKNWQYSSTAFCRPFPKQNGGYSCAGTGIWSRQEALQNAVDFQKPKCGLCSTAFGRDCVQPWKRRGCNEGNGYFRNDRRSSG